MNVVEQALGQLPGGRPTVPPDLDQMVKAIGADLQYTHERVGFDGATDLSLPRPLIELGWAADHHNQANDMWESGSEPTDRPPHTFDARTRFTLAHELGHILVHKLAARCEAARRLSPDGLERVCDVLAAEILMPPGWFHSVIGIDAGLPDLRRAADRAGVSMSSVMIRARCLGRGLAGVFMERDAGRDWRVARSYGVRISRGSILPNEGCDAMWAAPLKMVEAVQLSVPCHGHHHELEGELRRTRFSAVLVASRVDGRPVPAPRPWRCPS